eukprot:m.209690 g.209690  ORF g.209690 m.209690 type:complete len:841 (-) comp18994_c0_seq1:258-2780(-)
MSEYFGNDLLSAGLGASKGVLLTQSLSAISPSTVSRVLQKTMQVAVPVPACTSKRPATAAERNQQISQLRAAAKRTPTPRREDLQQEQQAKEDAKNYDDLFPWVLDFEFSLEDCDRIFGGVHVLLDDAIACHEFALSVASSVRAALFSPNTPFASSLHTETFGRRSLTQHRAAPDDVFQGVFGVMHLGVGNKLVRIPTGAYRRHEVLLVQLRTTPTVMAPGSSPVDEWDPDVFAELGAHLETAVDDANIRGTITMADEEEPLGETDPDDAALAVSIGATLVHNHGICTAGSQRRSSSSGKTSLATHMTRSLSLTERSGQSRPRRSSTPRARTPTSSRAPALARTNEPSFVQHAVRIPLHENVAHYLQHLKETRARQAWEAQQRRVAATQALESTRQKQHRREQRNQEEQQRIADRDQRRAERARQAELEVAFQKLQKKRDFEAAEKQRKREQRAQARAEEEQQQAMKQAARERAHRIAILEEENRVLHEQERHERTHAAREQTFQNIEAMKDAEKRKQAMLQFRKDAEWELHCRTIRAAGKQRRKQGMAAIQWGGTSEAEQQRLLHESRAHRTELAREKTLANVRQKQQLELEQCRSEYEEEQRERQAWEQHMRDTNARNKALGMTAIQLAQQEKEKIEEQNQRYADGRARIAASKAESRKRFEEKQAREAADAARLAAAEKIRVKEHRLQRERERQTIRKNAKLASEKEMQRVARQEIRRKISALPKPQSQADWNQVIQMLSQQDNKISSNELDFFCNGPKHRDFVKWYRTKYIEDALERGANNKRAWLPTSHVQAAVAAYAEKIGLPRESSLSADELTLRQERARQSASPTKRWIPPG